MTVTAATQLSQNLNGQRSSFTSFPDKRPVSFCSGEVLALRKLLAPKHGCLSTAGGSELWDFIVRKMQTPSLMTQ